MTLPDSTGNDWQAPLLADRRLLAADLLSLLAQSRPRVFSAYPAGYLHWLVADTLFIAEPFALDDVEALRTFLLMRFDIAPGFWRQPEIAAVLRDTSLAPMARWEVLSKEPFGQAWLDAARFDGAREWRERFWGEAGIPGEDEAAVAAATPSPPAPERVQVQVQDRAAMERQWLAQERETATPAEIAELEAALGVALPASYLAFVGRFGFVVFGGDAQRTRSFVYRLDEDGRTVAEERGISFLFPPKRALKAWRIMTDASDPEDDTSPMIPDGYLPVGSDAGQGTLLIELRTGGVFFWPESGWRWGTEDNLRLGRVADDFGAFIDALRPDPP